MGKLDAEQKERAQKEKWISELEEELKQYKVNYQKMK